MRELDFLVVGAQKAGTTSLHRCILEHPGLCVPVQKETEYFYRTEFYELGLDWYWRKFFDERSVGRICGEVSPQYMFNAEVPKRIRETFPRAKIIMILRDPVDRAFSHYRMTYRRGRETRDFADAVSADLVARNDSPDFGYVRFGEYGRILEEYLRFFDQGSIKVMFTEEFQQDRLGTIASIFGFLGVDDAFIPEAISRHHNVGGDRRFGGVDKFLRRQQWVKRLVGRVVGERRYNQLWLWYETEFSIRRKERRPPIPVAEILRGHYLNDVRLLERRLGRSVPWPRFATQGVREQGNAGVVWS